MSGELPKGWTRTTLDQLCPPDAPIIYGKLLGDQYSWAVSRLDVPDETAKRPHFANPRERLAEHLMTLYWWGELEPETTEGLLREFFEKADPKLREHALSFVGRSLHGTPPEKAAADSLRRAKALFERRLALATEKPKVFGAEFRGFGWWFSAAALDLDWRFRQIAGVLSVAADLEGAFLVVEELTNHVEQRPSDVLDALQHLLRCENPRWLVIGSRARFEAILSTALDHESAAVRERATAVVHRLGAQGHAGFRALLKTEEPTREWNS